MNKKRVGERDAVWLSNYFLCALQVFSTLSFSGSHVFSKLNRGFDVVIIDEAAQAVSLHFFYFSSCISQLIGCT